MPRLIVVPYSPGWPAEFARLAEDLRTAHSIKDPVCDVIIEGAEAWAVATDWAPGAPDG